jgi:hypothetical protein
VWGGRGRALLDGDLGGGGWGLEQEKKCDPKKQGFDASRDGFIHLSLDTGYTRGG